jgi:hypothetical protein
LIAEGKAGVGPEPGAATPAYECTYKYIHIRKDIKYFTGINRECEPVYAETEGMNLTLRRMPVMHTMPGFIPSRKQQMKSLPET